MSEIMELSSKAIAEIKVNKDPLFSCFSSPTSDDLLSRIDSKTFFSSGIDIQDLDITVPADFKSAQSTDAENVRKVYLALKDISDSTAGDERLWAGLCMREMWTYTQSRWEIKTPAIAIQHFFFAGKSPTRRSLTRNSASRLWWIGRLTYDESNSENPFYLTDFVCRYSRLVTDFLERNFSNGKPILKEFVTGCIEADRDMGPGVFDTDMARDLVKYLDILGGISVLDYLVTTKPGYLQDKIYKRALLLGKEKQEHEKEKQENRSVKPDSKVTIKGKNGRTYTYNLSTVKLAFKPSIIGKKVGAVVTLNGNEFTLVKID